MKKTEASLAVRKELGLSGRGQIPFAKLQKYKEMMEAKVGGSLRLGATSNKQQATASDRQQLSMAPCPLHSGLPGRR
jgi:hypothetical protein